MVILGVRMTNSWPWERPKPKCSVGSNMAQNGLYLGEIIFHSGRKGTKCVRLDYGTPEVCLAVFWLPSAFFWPVLPILGHILGISPEMVLGEWRAANAECQCSEAQNRYGRRPPQRDPKPRVWGCDRSQYQSHSKSRKQVWDMLACLLIAACLLVCS